jgi:hypothetical protein
VTLDREETAMANLMTLIGKSNALLFRVPVLGEAAVRGQSRAMARLAFHAPILGGKRCGSIREVRDEWLKFLKRSGITVVITREDDREFEFELTACPWGYSKPGEQGVCDACMDLDRTYVRLLGGELELAGTIPAGDACCRSVVRFRL